MPDIEQQVDEILDRMMKDVEAAVHSMYRGDVRQQTMRVKSERHRDAARAAIRALLLGARTPSAAMTPVASSAVPAGGAPLAADEISAITRCIMAWLPMGAPTTATPQSRCVPAARELAPSWGEREKARQAVRRLAG